MVVEPRQVFGLSRPKTSRQSSVLPALGILLAMLLLWVIWVSPAWAVPEPRKIDTGNVTKFSEVEAPAGETGAKGKEKLGKEKALREGEAEETGKAGAEEHVPVWMFPGWQTVFALLAVGYYAFMLTYLPKIMAKEEGHH